MDLKHSGFCHFIFNWIVVGQDGNVRACCPMRGSLGNLLEHTLEDVWNSESYRSFHEQGRDNGLPLVCERSPGCPYVCGTPRETKTLHESQWPTAVHLFLPNTFCNIGGLNPTSEKACLMCNRASTNFKAEPDMTLELVKKLRPAMPYLQVMHIQGVAEAFWKDRIFEILELMGAGDYRHNLTVCTVSNGTLLDSEMRRRWFKWPRSRVTWSIDAATEKTYRRLRRYSFDVVRKNAISYGRERDPRWQKFVMAFTINDFNINEVEGMVELGVEAGVDNMIFNPTDPYPGTQIVGHTVNKANAAWFSTAQAKIEHRAETLGVSVEFLRPLAHRFRC